jgi:hypothetical protein
MVYEARGDNQKAADCYRKVIDFMGAHPDDDDDSFEDIFARPGRLFGGPKFTIPEGPETTTITCRDHETLVPPGESMAAS